MKSLFYTMLFLLSAGLVYSQQRVFVAVSSQNNVNLFSVDLPNCTSHFIDTLPIGMGSIACTPDGRLWGVYNDTADGILYQIDTGTGSVTLAGHFATHGIYVDALTALNDSTLLFAGENGGDSLYGIITTNVHSYLIGRIGYISWSDLTWYGNNLYMIGFQGTNINSMSLIKMTFNNNYTAITSAIPVGNVPPLFCSTCGLATVVLPSMDTAMVAFSDTSAYTMSPLDGSYQLLCPILPDSFYLSDAASTLPPPTVVNTTPSANATKISLYPNPADKDLSIRYAASGAALVLTDIIGRVVLSQVLISSVTHIDIGNLTAGMYIATVQMDGVAVYRQKVIKK